MMNNFQSGMMEKIASKFNPRLVGAALGAIGGAGIGALAGGEDNRLLGAGLGALAGGAGGYGVGRLKGMYDDAASALANSRELNSDVWKRHDALFSTATHRAFKDAEKLKAVRAAYEQQLAAMSDALKTQIHMSGAKDARLQDLIATTMGK